MQNRPSIHSFALLSHQAAVWVDGKHSLSHLVEKGFKPSILLTPEHGFYAIAQDHEPVVSSDVGLPTQSLYGNHRASLSPKEEYLRDMDALVIDLVDIGTRYYTYAVTALYSIRVAAELDLPVILLDRPNLLGNEKREGPILREGFESFVGAFHVPIRHGMTLGELIRFELTREGLSANLTALPVSERNILPWVPPSPNMPTRTTALLYPGMCLLEATNLSEGRGTSLPFHVVGAPFLDGIRLSRTLNELDLPGVSFSPYSFRPQFQKWAGELCHGVHLMVTDPDRFTSFPTGVRVLEACFRQAPDLAVWRKDPYEFIAEIPALDLLTGSPELRTLLERGADLTSYLARCEEEAHKFRPEGP